MTDDKNGRLMPMYVSFSTFTTFLDWLKQMNVTPSKIDRTLWSQKFGGGTGGQLIVGLRFLKLLEGEEPTDELEALVRANTEERKALLADTLRKAYGPDLIADLPRMTPGLLNKALDELGTTDATRRKASSFLINAARAADLPIASGIAKKARNRPSKASAPRSAIKAKRPPADAKESKPTTPPVEMGNTKTVRLGGGGQVTLTVSVDLFELSEQDRAFVLGLVDKMKSYMDAQSRLDETTDGDNAEAPGSQSLAATPGASEGGSS